MSFDRKAAPEPQPLRDRFEVAVAIVDIRGAGCKVRSDKAERRVLEVQTYTDTSFISSKAIETRLR